MMGRAEYAETKRKENAMGVHASCLGGNGKKDYMVLMEKTFFYVQDMSTVKGKMEHKPRSQI